jgi:large subunit ribosomal protein LP2
LPLVTHYLTQFFNLLQITLFLMLTAQKDVEDFMKSSGISCDKAELETFFKALGDQSIPDLVAAGSKKTISMPRGGGGGGAAAGGAAKPAAEEKKEEAVEEVDMGGLFGDDDDY